MSPSLAVGRVRHNSGPRPECPCFVSQQADKQGFLYNLARALLIQNRMHFETTTPDVFTPGVARMLVIARTMVRLLDQHHLPHLLEVIDCQAVEIDAGRKSLCVEDHFMGAGVHPLVHQACHFLPHHVVHGQRRMARLLEAEPDAGFRVERVGVVLGQVVFVRDGAVL